MGKLRKIADGLYVNENEELVTEEGKHYWIKTEPYIITEENKNDISYMCSGCLASFDEKKEICPNCKSEMDMSEWTEQNWGCPSDDEEEV